MTLRACVVVPARDEEELIGACIAALAAQTGVARDDVRGAPRARPLHRRHRGARVQAAAGHDAARDPRRDGAGVGHARRTGMDLAAERLPPDGLIATTDADSDARARLAARRSSTRSPQGARAIGGRIEVGAHDLPPAALAPARGGRARDGGRSCAAPARASTTSSPARRSAVTAATYARVGGSSRATRWRTRASSARCAATACRSSGSPRCKVTTSGRRLGRAPPGPRRRPAPQRVAGRAQLRRRRLPARAPARRQGRRRSA